VRNRVGDPLAPQGGTLALAVDAWPSTVRPLGRGSHTAADQLVARLVYQSLLELDPVTLDLVPQLATHWQIAEDGRTFRFRLDPRARWSDGAEVTAEDWVATWRLRADPSLDDAADLASAATLNPPRAVSKYIVEVEAKEPGWRSLVSFALLPVLPSHEIAMLNGAAFLERYPFEGPPGTGPYEVRSEELVPGDRIVLRRNRDWWAETDPCWDGWHNLDRLDLVVVRDAAIAFDRLATGDLDLFRVATARGWAEDLPAHSGVKRGLVVPLELHTDAPIGVQGLALNTTRPPLDDARVRAALQNLLDRRTLIEKVFFNGYEPLASYFPTGGNPWALGLDYDPVAAARLLDAAGWTTRNADGVRTNKGRELALTIDYADTGFERVLTVFQEDALREGVRLTLNLLPAPQAWARLRARDYDVSACAWSGLLLPNPRASWHSSLASKPDTGNVTGLADPNIDAVCDAYDAEADPAQRAELLAHLDRLLVPAHPYVLTWFKPAQRVAVANRFGMPPWATVRHATDQDDLFSLWWVDPARDKALRAARADPNGRLDAPRSQIRFWQDPG
jgi:microcin C transport system substrate-binding protein